MVSKTTILVVLSAVLYFVTMVPFALVIGLVTIGWFQIVDVINNPDHYPPGLATLYSQNLPVYISYNALVYITPTLLLIGGILLLLWRNIAQHRRRVQYLGLMGIILGVLYIVIGSLRNINLLGPFGIPLYLPLILGGILILIASKL